MSQIHNELIFLVRAGVLGVVITFVYDNIRVIRRSIHHSWVFISIEDLLFWIWVTSRIFILQLEENNGSFRLFSIGSACVGMLVYRVMVSNFYINYMTLVMKWVLDLFYKICYYLLYPFFFVEDKIKKLIRKSGKRALHLACLQKIRLTSYIKMLRITLCKQKKREERRTTHGRKKSLCKKKASKQI